MLAKRQPKGVYGYLPIRPDLLKFIQWRENLAPDQALEVPGKGQISHYLATLIDFGKSLYFPGANRESREHPEHSAKLKFIAKPGLIDYTFFEYADKVAECFNVFLYHAWLEEQSRYVSIAVNYSAKLDAKDALEELRLASGMDDFRDSDADIKAYYRLRLHRGQVKPRPRSIAV